MRIPMAIPALKSKRQYTIKIFSDGAEKDSLLKMNQNPLISGMTTNPSLMKKAGISDYRSFCKDILTSIKTKPISFEVFADDFATMEKQAREITTWGNNVYVKIPVQNSEEGIDAGAGPEHAPDPAGNPHRLFPGIYRQRV